MPEPAGAMPAAGAAGSIGRLAWRLRLVILFAALAALPYLLSYSQQEIAVLLVINVLLVSSYRLLTLTGEWSLGHVVIMGSGPMPARCWQSRRAFRCRSPCSSAAARRPPWPPY